MATAKSKTDPAMPAMTTWRIHVPANLDERDLMNHLDLLPVSRQQIVDPREGPRDPGRRRGRLPVLPVDAELTTQEAADLLQVSRPFLVEQLEQGVISHRKVGTHRRVRAQDVIEYKHALDQSRLKVLDELAAYAQELDMGY